MSFRDKTKTAITLLSLVVVIFYGIARITNNETCAMNMKSYLGMLKNSSNKWQVGPRKQDPAFTLELNPNKTLVIVLSAFRSGSTFLGSIFDVNPHIQYLMEPFHSQAMRNLMAKGPSTIFGGQTTQKQTGGCFISSKCCTTALSTKLLSLLSTAGVELQLSIFTGLTPLCAIGVSGITGGLTGKSAIIARLLPSKS